MKVFVKTVFFALSLVLAWGKASAKERGFTWNGYLQGRFSDGSRADAGFSIRRAKLWVEGPAPEDGNMVFRVQGIFRYQTDGTFMLQDAYGERRLSFGFVRAGQFVPDFSLERAQSDAVLPLVERAGAVNSLIPTADTCARDIGAELVVAPVGSGFHASFGVYNGNGGNTKANEDGRFLYTSRTTCDVRMARGLSWTSGFSVAYRDKSGLAFPGILGAGKTFSGEDFRWGLETHLKSGLWEIQGEYIQADLENQVFYGYYVLGDYALGRADEVSSSVERIQVANPAVSNGAWYIIGYSHFFNGQKEKVMVDARSQYLGGPANYGATVQFQLFFK